MNRVQLYTIFIIGLISSHVVLSSPVVQQDPLELKKHHAMCGVCKALIKGGELVGNHDLDAWLDVNIGTLCWSFLLVIHKKCERKFHEIKKDLKNAIEHGLEPEKACHGLDLC